MTAGELIEILAQWPADAPVMVTAREHSGLRQEISEVWRSPTGKVIIEA